MCHESEHRPPADRCGSEESAADPGRRHFIALLAWGAATAFFPGIAAAARSTLPQARKISFHNLHTGELLSTCYWERGAYVPAALEEINAVLRDHRTGEVGSMNPRLLDLVHSLQLRLGETSPVQVISGYRSAATNARLRAADPRRVAKTSRHLTGEAVDIRFENRPLRGVRDAALSLGGGGVGYYPRSGFVHLDIGPRRRW